MPQMSTWKKTVKGLVSTVPREAGACGQGELPEAGPEGKCGAEGGDPAKAAALPIAGERGVDQHDGHAGQGENDFGKDAEDVGNGIHRWASP